MTCLMRCDAMSDERERAEAGAARRGAAECGGAARRRRICRAQCCSLQSTVL